MHVLITATGENLPEQIPNTAAASPSWLDDGRGFFYNQLTGAVNTPERFLDSQARFHALGSDPGSDPILMKRGLDPSVVYERIQAPVIVTYPGAKHALLTLGDIRQEYRIFIAPVADAVTGKAKWAPVAGFEDEITDCDIEGDELYLLANRGAPRGRILKTSIAAPHVANAQEVVARGSGGDRQPRAGERRALSDGHGRGHPPAEAPFARRNGHRGCAALRRDHRGSSPTRARTARISIMAAG